MKNRKIRIFVYILAALPLIIFLALYRSLPEQMPAHWNIDGTVRYNSKNTFFLFVGMPVLFLIIGNMLPTIMSYIWYRQRHGTES